MAVRLELDQRLSDLLGKVVFSLVDQEDDGGGGRIDLGVAFLADVGVAD